MNSVADPGCLSLILNPTTGTIEEGEIISCLNFLVATNITKLKLFYFYFCAIGTEKKLNQFTRLYSTFYSKNCHRSLKNTGWGPGSEKSIPNPNVKDPIQQWSFLFLIGWYLPGPGPMAGSRSKQTEQSSVKGRRLELASFCLGACRGQKGIIWHHHGSSNAYIVTSGNSS